MSFSCPNYDYGAELCKKIKVTCVPGRTECVLDGMVTFAGDIETQIKNTEELNHSRRGKRRIYLDGKNSP